MFTWFKAKTFGVDISDSSIEVLQFQPAGERAQVTAYGRLTLSPGVIEDGRIKKPQELVQGLQTIVAKTKPANLKGKQVISALPESQVFSTIITLPLDTNPDAFLAAIIKQAQTQIPLDLNDCYSDFKVIAQTSSSQELFFVASPKPVVQSYLEVFTLAGLDLIVLEIESLALARSLLKDYNKIEAYLIADLGARTTNINIFDHEGIRYSEAINIAGNSLTQKLAEHLKLNWPEAEALKIKQGFSKQKIRSIILPDLRLIGQKISEAVRYYERTQQRIISQVILAGGTALLPDLGHELEQQIKVKVITSRDTIYAPVMGLAFRGLLDKPEAADINFLKYLK